MMIAAVDWWEFVLFGSALAVPTLACVTIIALIRGELKAQRKELETPSGETIGKVAERTLDLAAVNAAALALLLKELDKPPS